MASWKTLSLLAALGSRASAVQATKDCPEQPSTLHLDAPPSANYFYSDCHSASQVVVTSPEPDSNLSIVSPRLLIAWPAGNSGIATYFLPANGVNGSLSIVLAPEPGANFPISPLYEPQDGKDPVVGVRGLLSLNSTAVSSLSILGSIRSIRDFSEGGGTLVPLIQDGVHYEAGLDGSAKVYRQWLDNCTTTQLVFKPTDKDARVTVDKTSLTFQPGTYEFTGSFNYPQLNQLNASEVLNAASAGLITQEPDQTDALAFLSYSDKLLAGAWRFLTYFGRDSMIFFLLAQPVLSNEASEAVISAVLERINGSTGAVCHEETIGDYATYQRIQMGQSGTDPLCTYVMIDTDYYLPIILSNYFNASTKRTKDLLAKTATLSFGNKGKTYESLALLSAERIMSYAAPFTAPGNQTVANLRHLMPDQPVGEWRDSNAGLGTGRIPLDVNTGLVPAALRAISALSAAGLWTAEHPDWASVAASYAQVWEDSALSLFEVTEPAASARHLVDDYASRSGFAGPTNSSTINDPVTYYALALNDSTAPDTAPTPIKVLNSDTAFRLFLLNATNDDQLGPFLRNAAAAILAPYPRGLTTDTGLLVANPAYVGTDPYAASFTSNAYHGTVIWSWPMAMTARGLERQIARCSESEKPAFCTDDAGTLDTIRAAYNVLWDVIDGNTAHLTNELWSWRYVEGKGYEYVDYSTVSTTESDVRQLWSLVYLAVRRDESLR